MLEKLDLTKSLSKAEYKEKMAELTPKLGKLQGSAARKRRPDRRTHQGARPERLRGVRGQK